VNPVTNKYFPGLTEEQIQRFDALQGLYREWNDQINVISRKDINNFNVNHLLHSLAIAKLISFIPGTEVLDVGTGGGLPGIPLAIMFPSVRFTLIDSVAKKIKVVNGIAESLNIKNISAITTRSEDFTGRYDFIVSRAVTDLQRFIHLTRHLIAPYSVNPIRKGYICLKGGDLDEELAPYSGKSTVTDISKWFDEPFFETKKIVYLPWTQ